MAINFRKIRNPEIKKVFDDHFENVCRLYDLGAPVVADDDKIVTSANMKVGAYTIAAQPDVCRNITVTATAVGAADTMGKITVVGTNYDGETISEEITPSAGSTVAGAKAFKTVTSVTGSGWVIGEGNDTIKVGVGDLLGAPCCLADDVNVPLGILGTTVTAVTVTHDVDELEKNTVSMATGTYNGSKHAIVFIVE